MVEELRETDAQVLAISSFHKVVLFVVVLEQPSLLAQTTETYKHFDTLIPRHCTVLVVVHNQYRSAYVRQEEEWRVFVIEVECFPQRLTDTALSLFVLYLASDTASPTDTTVCTGHVRYRSTCTSRLELVGLGNHVSHLVATPTLTLDSHVFAINPWISLFEHFHTWHDRLHRALSRMTICEVYVWYEYYIAITYKVWDVHSRTARCRVAMTIQRIRILFVEIDHDRILLVRVEIFRLEEETFAEDIIGSLPVHEFYCTPIVFTLLRVDVAQLLLSLEVIVRCKEVVAFFEVATSINEYRLLTLATLRVHEIAECIRTFYNLLDALLLDFLHSQAVFLAGTVVGSEVDWFVHLQFHATTEHSCHRVSRSLVRVFDDLGDSQLSIVVATIVFCEHLRSREVLEVELPEVEFVSDQE